MMPSASTLTCMVNAGQENQNAVMPSSVCKARAPVTIMVTETERVRLRAESNVACLYDAEDYFPQDESQTGPTW